jgi:hypothetical protein
MAKERRLWKIRDKRRFLIEAMKELAGAAHISFEGDLSGVTLSNLPGASGGETPVLKRNTLRPIQDFVILPLEIEDMRAISAAIGGTFPRAILHMQIEKDGRLELGVYDNFDVHAMFFGSALTPEFLSRLEAEAIATKWTDR